MKIKHFEKASKIIDFIRLSNQRWTPKTAWQSHWVFRGQANSAWELRPLLMRTNTLASDHFRAIAATVPDDDIVVAQSELAEFVGMQTRDLPLQRVKHYLTLRKAEFLAIRSFFEVCNELGLDCGVSHFDPYDTQYIYQSPSSQYINDNQLFPLISLAQHHGRPTRLLDWTHRPEHAAVFALEQELQSGNGSMAIWCLDLFGMTHERWYKRENYVRPRGVMRSAIQNVRSQQSLFTIITDSDERFLRTGEWPSVEQVIPQHITKLTLPWSEAKELRRLLFVEGFHIAKMMPTYDNVNKLLAEHESIWEDRI